MNPVALYFASGESLYSGAALLLLTVVLSPFVKNRWLVLTRNVSAWISLAMIVMACPPFPWFVDLLFLAAFALWLILWNLAPRRAPRSVTASLLVALLIVLPALELGHRNLPMISGESSDHLVVIGDSISSGIDPRVPAWPAVMQEMSGLRVVNMARPGAYAQDGLKMADEVMPGDRLVLIEIGGNDLIIGVPASEFGRSLEGLLQKVARPGRTVVMFELPLLPWRISYGQDPTATCKQIFSVSNS